MTSLSNLYLAKNDFAKDQGEGGLTPSAAVKIYLGFALIQGLPLVDSPGIFC